MPDDQLSLAIGRRAYALIHEFTQGDPALFRAVSGMKRDMMSDPGMARSMPGAPQQFGLLSSIIAELRRRGEIKT